MAKKDLKNIDQAYKHPSNIHFLNIIFNEISNYLTTNSIKVIYIIHLIFYKYYLYLKIQKVFMANTIY